MTREIVALTVLLLGVTVLASCAKIESNTNDYGFSSTLSKDVFPLEREANEIVWVPEQSAFYTHGGDKGEGYGYTESDSGIYKYVPGSTPIKVADLPIPLHHIGFAYCPDTEKIYTYGGGQDFIVGGNQICWFDPKNNNTGVCTETYPYRAVALSAEYSTTQKVVYLFGGFNSEETYREIWKHDPIAGTVTKVDTAILGDGFCFQATVYVDTEDAVYLFGGFNESGTTKTDIYRFDCAVEEITRLNVTCPDNKTKGMGSYYDFNLNAVVLAGGRDGNPWTAYTNRIWVLYLSSHITDTLACTIPAPCDDLDGGYDPTTGKGYFMRVVTHNYRDTLRGYIGQGQYCRGSRQKYICEVAYQK